MSRIDIETCPERDQGAFAPIVACIMRAYSEMANNGRPGQRRFVYAGTQPVYLVHGTGAVERVKPGGGYIDAGHVGTGICFADRCTGPWGQGWRT